MSAMELKPLEDGWRHALRLWWSFTWRWPLYLLVPLVPIAMLIALATSPERAISLVMPLGWPLVIGAQVFTFRRLLRLEYKGFRIRVLEPNTPES